MTGNIALDIAIGLVFVFVLYSLLASIIAEIIATFLGLRARNLKAGIERMLDEDKKGLIPNVNWHLPLFNKLIDYLNDLLAPILGYFGRPNKKTAVYQFYKHPIVKFMAKDKFFSKPSYIPSSSFSKVVLDLLKEGEGTSDLEKIQKNLKQLEENSAEMEQLKQNLKKNPADAVSIKAKINALEESSFLHGESLKLVASFLSDADNDVEKFKENLESWFNNTMDRVAGWYKRKSQFILFVIGIFIAINFNVSTIQITHRLAKDESARTQMVALASTYVDENPDLVNRIDQLKAGDSTDTNLQRDIQLLNARLDSLLSIKEDLQDDIDHASRVLGFSLPDSLKAELVKPDDRRAVADTLHPNQVFVNDSQFVITFPDKYMAANAGRHYAVDEEDRTGGKSPFYARLNFWDYISENLIGYLLTAFAISLGAPFWFDLLNKLVKLRSSTRPDAPSDDKKKA